MTRVQLRIKLSTKALVTACTQQSLTGGPSLLSGDFGHQAYHRVIWLFISRYAKGVKGSTLPPWLVVTCNDLHGCVQVHATWRILCHASLAALPLRQAPAAAAGQAAIATIVLVSICRWTMAATLWSNLPALRIQACHNRDNELSAGAAPAYHLFNESEKACLGGE